MLKAVKAQKSTLWNETPSAASRGPSSSKREPAKCGGQKYGARQTIDDSMDVTDLEELPGLFQISSVPVKLAFFKYFLRACNSFLGEASSLSLNTVI